MGKQTGTACPPRCLRGAGVMLMVGRGGAPFSQDPPCGLC